jgi:hypothetical protein
MLTHKIKVSNEGEGRKDIGESRKHKVWKF